MYGRTYPDGEAALEALLRQIDAEVAHSLNGGASQEAVPEALAFALDGEAMDGIDAAKQVIETAQRVMDVFDPVPDDIKDAIKNLASQGWDARGALLDRLIMTAITLIGGNRSLPPIKALQTAAVQLNIPPRRGVPAQKGLSTSQVKASDRRQEQRGRKPGQNLQARARRQSESELESEWEAEWEAESTPSPMVQNICLTLGNYAEQLRKQVQRVRANPKFDARRKQSNIRDLQHKSSGKLNRIIGQIAPTLDRLQPGDLDRLNGCLTRVASATGFESSPLKRLRGEIGRRLGVPKP